LEHYAAVLNERVKQQSVHMVVHRPSVRPAFGHVALSLTRRAVDGQRRPADAQSAGHERRRRRRRRHCRRV